MVGLRLCWMKAFGYAVLWLVPGAFSVIEGARINRSVPWHGGWFESPGAYVYAVGFLLLVFAAFEAALAVRNVRTGKRADGKGPSLGVFGHSKTQWSVLLIGLYVLMVPWLGFTLATGLFLIPTLRLLGCSYRVVALVSLATCLSLHFGSLYLGVSLPHGPFRF